MNDQYRIRKAAGIYWLLDMEQEGYPEYQKPVPLNEAAVELWNLMREYRSLAEVAEWLSREKNLPRAVAEQDVRDFAGQLMQRGIKLPGTE